MSATEENPFNKGLDKLIYMMAGIGLLYLCQLSNVINMVVPSPKMTIGSPAELTRR